MRTLALPNIDEGVFLQKWLTAEIYVCYFRKESFTRYILKGPKCNSSHLVAFFKIGALKNFAIFTGKHLCWSFFLIKLLVWRLATLLNRNSNPGVFLWILRNFSDHFFAEHLQTAASVNAPWKVSRGLNSWHFLTFLSISWLMVNAVSCLLSLLKNASWINKF